MGRGEGEEVQRSGREEGAEVRRFGSAEAARTLAKEYCYYIQFQETLSY